MSLHLNKLSLKFEFEPPLIMIRFCVDVPLILANPLKVLSEIVFVLVPVVNSKRPLVDVLSVLQHTCNSQSICYIFYSTFPNIFQEDDKTFSE